MINKPKTVRQGKEEIMKTYDDIMNILSGAHVIMTTCDADRKCKSCKSTVACWMFAIAKQSFAKYGKY